MRADRSIVEELLRLAQALSISHRSTIKHDLLLKFVKIEVGIDDF